MTAEYRSDDWDTYLMDWHDPHRILEPLEKEIGTVQAALSALVDAGILPTTTYDLGRMMAHRKAVRQSFQIPWTAITPRMQRLLYAINSIARPEVLVAVGIFCGNTFISNAGAAIGPGSCYRAEKLVGIEIRPEFAELARSNVSRLGHWDNVEIVAADGMDWLASYDGKIDLLYLDADGQGGRGKSIYLDLLRVAEPRLREGSLVLAHNSVNSARQLSEYLAYVRSAGGFRKSVNVVLDDQGLEVTLR